MSFLTAMGVVMNSSFARDTVKKIIHYSGTNYTLQEVVASKLEADYPEVRNVLVANGSPWYYARLNVVPEERYFYLPTVDYDMFPDAADAQVEAVLKGKAEAVIVEWAFREGGLWLGDGARDDDINAGLAAYYDEFVSAGNTSLFIRNDFS